MSLFTLHINCEESGFTGKPVMDLVDPSQVDHEGGSGARPKVDHQGSALHRHVQQADTGPGVRVMDQRVGGWAKLPRRLKQKLTLMPFLQNSLHCRVSPMKRG